MNEPGCLFHRQVFLNGSTLRVGSDRSPYSETFQNTLRLLEQPPKDTESQRFEEFVVSRIRSLKGVESLLGFRGAALLHRRRTSRYPIAYLSRFYSRVLYRTMCCSERLPLPTANGAHLTEGDLERHDRAFERLQEDLAAVIAHARMQQLSQKSEEKRPQSVTYHIAVQEFLQDGGYICHDALVQMFVFLHVERRLHLLPRIEHHLRLLDDRIHIHVSAPLELDENEREVIKAATVREYQTYGHGENVSTRLRFSFGTPPRSFTGLTERIVREVLGEQIAQLRH